MQYIDNEESIFIRHEPCPNCGSRDNLARYSDGHAYCFGCNYRETSIGGTMDTSNPFIASDLLDGDIQRLVKRNISYSTCAFWDYRLGEYRGKKCQIATYRNSTGKAIAQKLRFPDKTFKFIGETKNVPLYGSWLWGDKGRRIVITEGEIDALSVSEVNGNKYPVVSVPNGAQSAKRAIRNNLEYLEGFDEVIFMFDMDDQGQKAAIDCAELLSVGKAKIARLPLKDANEMLVAGRNEEVVKAIFTAVEYRPDGLVSLSDIVAEVIKPVERGLSWFLPSLTEHTYGRRYGEIYAFGAGTGVGKTDVFTQSIAYDIKELKQRVAVFYLEQDKIETGKRIAGKMVGKRFHVPDGTWTTDELVEALSDKELVDRVTLYDSFGVTDWEHIKGKIKYLASNGVKLFYIDHLTALATGHHDNGTERELLEEIMADMASLAKRYSIIIHLVSHLATPDGKPHEEGGRVMIRHFKGSRAIGFWCYFMFGLERNQQDKDESKRQTTVLRVLKDRYTGQSTGKTIVLGYDVLTGLIYEKDELFIDAEDMF